MCEEYLTLKNTAHDEFTEKRSRFIGYAKHVENQSEAVEFIEEIRTKHWDATHNVYAYILRDGQTRRYSDDGEPSGTAGVPVLDVMIKENLTDCVVVATRYFGGTLLGAGGLVRAYSHTAKIAVDAAGIVKMSMCYIMYTECDYNYYGKLSSLIPECSGVIDESLFEDNVKVTFHVPSYNADMLISKLTDTSFGKYSAKKLEEKYFSLNL